MMGKVTTVAVCDAREAQLRCEDGYKIIYQTLITIDIAVRWQLAFAIPVKKINNQPDTKPY